MSSYSVPRALALLCLVWAVQHVFLAIDVQDHLATPFLLVWALIWATLAVFLWLGQVVMVVSLAVLALCAAELLLLDFWPEYAVMIIAWLALIVAVAPRRQHDQLILARILLSTVYLFAALSKIQPSWLRGDDLQKLAASRPQAAWLEPFLVQPWIVLAAAAVIMTEFGLAVALWFPRTRLLAAAAGILLHITLTILATLGGMPGLLHLVALNGGLVLLYPAFWQPLSVGEAAPERSPAPST